MSHVVNLCSSDNEGVDDVLSQDSLAIPVWSATELTVAFAQKEQGRAGNRHENESFLTSRQSTEREPFEIDLSNVTGPSTLPTRSNQSIDAFRKVASPDPVLDPITFTLSANRDDLKQFVRQHHAGEPKSTSRDESEDELPEPQSLVQPKTNFSSRTASILAETSIQRPIKVGSRSGSIQKRKRSSEDEVDDIDDKEKESAPSKPRKPQRLTSTERQVRAAEKERLKEEKAKIREEEREKRNAQKEVEKERKQQKRELKAQERQKAADLAEVNKLKVDRRVTTPEMIVYLPASIEGKSVDNQVRELLQRANAKARTWESDIPGIVKWRQQVDRDFDEELSHWVRADRVDDCRFILCLLSGEQFCSLASGTNDESETIEMHLAKLRNAWPDCQIIYCIEGLEAWIRRSKNAQNRAYQAAVRRVEEQEPTQSRRRKRASVQVDEEAVEEALLELQVIHKCKVQQTSTAAETAEYILSFTQQISLIRHG